MNQKGNHHARARARKARKLTQIKSDNSNRTEQHRQMNTSMNTQGANPMQAIGKLLKFPSVGSGSMEDLERLTLPLQRREQEQLYRERVANRQRTLDQRVFDAGVPAQYRGATLADYRPENAAEERALLAATEFAANFDPIRRHGACLILCGPNGVGKTLLAAAALQEIQAADFHRTVLFITETALLLHLRSAFDPHTGSSEAQTWDALIKPDLLVIDEAGSDLKGNPEKRQAMLQELVNARLDGSKEGKRPFILTSNHPPHQLARHYGRAAWSRLTGEGSEVVWISGRDRRRATAAR